MPTEWRELQFLGDQISHRVAVMEYSVPRCDHIGKLSPLESHWHCSGCGSVITQPEMQDLMRARYHNLETDHV